MKELSGARVTVTGGAGFVGSHLTDALLGLGAELKVIDDLSTGRGQNVEHLRDKVEFIHGSILDPATLARAVDGAKYVFHQAAVPSVPKSVRDPLTSHAANATGTLAVLMAARAANVDRVVYAGSSSYYGDAATLPKQEDMPPSPQSPYALQKYAGEAYGRMFHQLYGLEVVTLRYFNIYGPRQNPDSEYAAVIPRFIRSLKKGARPIVYGDGSTTRDFTFVSDCVDANIRAVLAPDASGKAFNVAGGRQISLNDLLGAMQKLLGTRIEPVYEDFRPGDVRHSLADTARARDILKFVPRVSLEEGLRRTVECAS